MLTRKSAERRRRAAFTLMEMLVVVAIIVALASIGGFFIMGALSDTQKDTASLQVKGALTAGVQAYAIKHSGRYPENLQQLLLKDEFGGPYLDNPDVLIDPWKQQYQYDIQGTQNNGLKPDIWTVDPKTNEKIGNWPKNRINSN